MNQFNPYENDLITRYLCGEASEEEIQQLSQWLREDTEHRKVFEELRLVWTKVNINVVEEIDLDDEWQKQDQKISKKVLGLSQSYPLKHFLKIAAIFLIFALPAYFLITYFITPTDKILTASSGIMEEELPDGTKVTMNEGTVIHYSFKKRKTRNIDIKGEAYFRVAHDEKHPFVISGNDIRVEVLGTSFLINTQGKDGTVEIVLDTGKVAVYQKDKKMEQLFLSPGQRAVVKDGKISISQNIDPNYVSWKTRRFVFVNDSLSVIIGKLENAYQTHIILSDPALASCRVTATFDHQTEESVMNILKETLSLSLEKSNNGYTLSGPGCH